MTNSTKRQDIKNGTVKPFTQADVNRYWAEGNDAWTINFSSGKEIPITTVRRWIKADGGFIYKGIAYLAASSSLFTENR